MRSAKRRKTQKLEEPAKLPEMIDPESDQNFREMWSQIEPQIENVLVAQECNLSVSVYMKIYGLIYNYITKSVPFSGQEAMLEMNGGSPQSYLTRKGTMLYCNLRKLLTTNVKATKQQGSMLSDRDMLMFYSEKWTNYERTSKFLDHLMTYLNRFWLPQSPFTRGQVYRIYEMCLRVWREHFFEKVVDEITKSLLKMLEKERMGEKIDGPLVRNIIKSYAILEVTEDQSLSQDEGTRNHIYKSKFEDEFLTATSEFYSKESQQSIKKQSVVDYIKRAHVRLQEEENRVTKYLLPSTMETLVYLCQARLIKDHQEVFCEEFKQLLVTDRVDGLNTMFMLLNRIPELLDPLRIHFEQHVRKMGLEAIAMLQEIDSKLYVDTILQVRSKYAELQQKAFPNDHGFTASLDRACREFVNRNKVSKGGLNSTPELLARYSDSLLRKSARNPDESEIEELLCSIMVVFQYIEDKDIFQTFYEKMLAKRLVGQNSASEDLERQMITKLKDSCGFEYTAKLQRMFTDMTLSKDLNDVFRKEVQLMDFNVMVLSHASWPFNPPQTDFNIPEEFISAFDSFTKFYQGKHSGRRLQWLFQFSSGELKANFGTKVQYTFQVNMYQMGILLMFNLQDDYSLQVLKDSTKLDLGILVGNLQIFLKAKILICNGVNESLDSKYSLNKEYRNKKIRMNLNVAIKPEIKQETEEAQKTVQEDRKILIQAAIVRIMKTRKSMKHALLISEVLSQLQQRFLPKVSDIKKSIDVLLEKEYIERQEGSRDVYSYIA